MNRFFQWRFAPKRKDASSPPQSGIGLYFYVLVTHFWKFVTLNLLLVAFALPVVTLPAAICAVNRVCVLLIREGNCFLWDDFFKEFRSSFRKSLPMGLLFGVGIAAGYYLVSLGLSNGQSIFGMLFLATGLFLSIGTALLGSWAFVLLAMLPLRCADVLKNARALTGLEGKRDIAILATHAAVLAFTLMLLPFSLIPLPLFLLSLAQYTVCFLVNTAVQQRVIAPFEAAQKAKEALQ